MVIHHQVTLVQETGDAKGHRATVDDRGKGNAGSTERAVGDENWFSADRVVDDLMPIGDFDRIGLGFASLDDAEDPVLLS